MDEIPKIADLEKRIARLEARPGGGFAEPLSIHPVLPLLLGMGAVAMGFLGVGLPQHYYQILFSLLLLLLLYHRGNLLFARGPWKWPQIIVNVLVLCLLFKLLIGGGVIHPLEWFKLPALTKAPPSGGQSWYSTVVPDYTLQWEAIPALAQWGIDITRIQTILLIAIFAGTLFRFEPFTSITALVMLVISLPAYLRFNWDWTVPFIIAGSVSLYLQACATVSLRR